MRKTALQKAMAENGRRGGRARALALSPVQRSKAARRAALARWGKAKA